MDIKEAAKKLRLSQRHIRRLIDTGALPAKKVKKMIEVEAWEINDEVLEAASNTLTGWEKYETFTKWMIEKTRELGMTAQELSKRTKLPILEFIDGMTAIGKNPKDLEARDTIVAALLRATIERRAEDVKQ